MHTCTPDFEHDLFVSYGCVDDQKGDNGEQGWVSCLVEDLKKRLSERLGRKDTFSVWKDEERLLRHVDLETQIAKAIESSACMLVVLSPSYLRSDWCQRERCGFLNRVRERDANGWRIFVIERDWIEEDKPEEFRNLLGFRFWTGTPSNQADLPRPLDKNRQSDRNEYDDQINRVTHALASELRRLKSASLQNDWRPIGGVQTSRIASQVVESAAVRTVGRANAATVFLAEVTDDLRPQWKKIRSELDQQGLRVLSGGAMRDAAALARAVDQSLQESQIFVQLLSQFPGQPLPGASESYTLLQYRLAVDSKKRLLQWRSPSLTEEVFDQQEVEDPELAALHRGLVFGRVRAEHIEDFKRHVIQVATEPPRQEPPRTGLGMVFVSFNPNSSDSALAEDLCGYLGQRGFGVITPVDVEDADPEEIEADFEGNVLGSRSWIVVYGDQKQKYWVRGQLNRINQLLCEHNKPNGFIHLCAGPPAPKEVSSALKLVGIQLPRMRVIDCQGGFEDSIENLFQFLDELSVPVGGAGTKTAAGEQAVVPV